MNRKPIASNLHLDFMRCSMLLLVLSPLAMYAQIPEVNLMTNIETVRLHPYGNQLGNPIIRLNTTDQLELHFDDMHGNVKNFSYTYQLCNADWTPAILSHFDYIRGFSQMRITTYRISSIAFTRYTHYQAILPDRNCIPSRSGNYILKVFLNGDTSQLAFTRRIMVVDEKAMIRAEVQQPFDGNRFKTHQKVQFRVNITEQLNVVNALQQIKVTILQNNRWDNAISNLKPTFFSRNQLEYNTENDAVFPAGKEWRWLDLRSFRLQTDRVADAVYTNTATKIFLKPDLSRTEQRFNFYRDMNGKFTIEVSENINPYWQADYATVHFRFVPPGGLVIPGREVHVFGALSNYALNEKSRLRYNVDEGVYETALFLKQGYYDYAFVTVDPDRANPQASFELTEGNFWETENDYTILVYYRPLAGRADELVGYTVVNSLTGRRGVAP